MPTKKAFQSSVLSLQSDVPYLLGRKAVSTSSNPTASAATRPAAAAVNNLDKIATTALKAKALEQKSSSSSKSSIPSTASPGSQLQQPPTPDTFRTWRVTQPQHWSDGLIRPPSQEEAPARSAPSPHWASMPLRGVVGSGSPQQVQLLGK